MGLLEQIMAELQSLPATMQREVLDFAWFLQVKEEMALDRAMDSIIADNLKAFRELAN